MGNDAPLLGPGGPSAITCDSVPRPNRKVAFAHQEALYHRRVSRRGHGHAVVQVGKDKKMVVDMRGERPAVCLPTRPDAHSACSRRHSRAVRIGNWRYSSVDCARSAKFGQVSGPSIDSARDKNDATKSARNCYSSRLLVRPLPPVIPSRGRPCISITCVAACAAHRSVVVLRPGAEHFLRRRNRRLLPDRYTVAAQNKPISWRGAPHASRKNARNGNRELPRFAVLDVINWASRQHQIFEWKIAQDGFSGRFPTKSPAIHA